MSRLTWFRFSICRSICISADGSRPAWHVPGANALLGLADMPWEDVASCRAVHFGGVSALRDLDGPPTTEILRRVHAGGALTTVDCLGVKRPDLLELLSPAFPYIDCFLPDEDELTQMTGIEDPLEGARLLREGGLGAVVVTRGSDGALVACPEGEFEVAAIPGEAVDSSGCGDALVAGTLFGLLSGWTFRRSVELGTAAASLTLGRLGSVAGIESWDQVFGHMQSNFPTERKR